MALVDVGNSRMVPDDHGGWYWVKWANGKWEPVEVQPAQDGRTGVVVISGTIIAVTHPYLRWGHQILPPDK